MSRLVLDTESDGLLKNATKVHCIGIKDISYPDEPTEAFNDNPSSDCGYIDSGLERLYEADELIGHNISGHDLPVLEKNL